jgi:hypothetical protein
MLKSYFELCKTSGQCRLFGGLSFDHCALNAISYITKHGSEKNMVLVTGGPYKDENRPISHICCYTFTPYNRDLPKILIFAQAHWDGHAR